MLAEINSVSYGGSHYQYFVSSEIGELFVISNETDNFHKLNEEVFLTFDKSGINILED